MEEILLKEELALYEPRPEVLQKLGEVVLYGIVAPYGSGKDSIINWLVTHYPNRFAVIVGDTTRQPRKDEADGVEYHFRSKGEMIDDLHNRRFVQVVPGFTGNFYATRPEQYPTDKIGLKPIQAREMMNYKKYGLKELKWLQIVPHSEEAWVEWQALRKYDQQDLIERNEEAIQSYALALVNPDTHFILNDEVEKAAQRIIRIADGRQPTDESRAKVMAMKNLEALKTRRNAK